MKVMTRVHMRPFTNFGETNDVVSTSESHVETEEEEELGRFRMQEVVVGS